MGKEIVERDRDEQTKRYFCWIILVFLSTYDCYYYIIYFIYIFNLYLLNLSNCYCYFTISYCCAVLSHIIFNLILITVISYNLNLLWHCAELYHFFQRKKLILITLISYLNLLWHYFFYLPIFPGHNILIPKNNVYYFFFFYK